MTVSAFTLGCKVNQYDTDAILQGFASLGFTLCQPNDTADIYLINTCTVTNISDKKSRQMINRAYKQNPNAFIVAYGCYAQVAPDVLEKVPGVAMVIGTDDKHRVAELVAERLQFHSQAKTQQLSSTRTRAYLKIQDGCDRYCSYCIVPYARGGISIRSIPDAYAEADALVQNGCKEIVITGIQIASYGNDLIKLIKRIHDIPGLKRLRLSSIEPNLMIDTDILQSLSALPKLCDHFHLSLQSGSDRILKRMNRRYTTEAFLQGVQNIRDSFPLATITTDIIAGFPGETDRDFEETLTFAKQVGFFRIHVFPYSPKAGTPAADFPDQINQQIKDQRSRILRDLAEDMHKQIYQKYIGHTLPVLFESESGGIWEGHTTQYLTVKIPSEENLQNHIIPVTIQ